MRRAGAKELVGATPDRYAHDKGVKVCGSEKEDLERRLQRATDRPW